MDNFRSKSIYGSMDKEKFKTFFHENPKNSRKKDKSIFPQPDLVKPKYKNPIINRDLTL